MSKLEKDNLLSWKVEQLQFKPINCSIQTNRINEIKINVNDEPVIQSNFILNSDQRQILNPLNFKFKTNDINLNLNFNEIIDDNYYQPQISKNFLNDRIDHENSFIYNQRKTFLNSNQLNIKIDNTNIPTVNINLGDKDPWVM